MDLLDNKYPHQPNDEASVAFQPIVTRWAIIATIASIILTLVQYLSGLKTNSIMAGALLGFVALAMSVFFMRSAVVEHRDKELGGYISFKRAFIICLLVGVLSATLTQIFNFVYLNYISPSTLQTLLESSREMMESMNAPEEQVDQAIASIEESMTSPSSLLTAPIGSALLNAALGAIVAAVLKRKPPFS